MAVSPTFIFKGGANLRLDLAGATRTVGLSYGGGNWPDNYVESSSFSVTVSDNTSGASPPSAFYIIALVEDAVDVSGNYVTATGGSTLSTGVLAVLNLGQNPTAGTYTIGNGLNGAGGSDSRNAALSKFGTFRIVISAGNTLNAALRVSDGGGAGAFHHDTDANDASGAGNLVTSSIFQSGAGGVKCKLTSATRTSGNWGYGTGTITASFTFKSAIDGTSAPYTNASLKDMKVCWSTDSGVTTPVKKQSDTISSTGVIDIPATNIDTDWGQAIGGTSYYTEIAVGQNFGDATTPAGEKAALYAVASTDAGDNERMAYVFANTTQTSPYVNSSDTNRRIRTNTADQLASSAIQSFQNTGLTTAGVGVFSSSGRTTAQTVFKRTGAVNATNAVPYLRVYVADAYTAALPNTKSLLMTVRTPTGDSDVLEDTQTLTTGGGTGNVDWNYTIANNDAAFNRYVKSGTTRVSGSHVATGPDNPDSPAARITLTATATTVGTSQASPSNTLIVTSATSFSPGMLVNINRAGGSQEYARITDIASNTLTLAATTTSAHSAGETVELAVPVYQKDVRIVGNAFAGTKEPTSRTTMVFGVNSGILFEDMWTGDSASATLDGNGVPTGSGKREQTLGAGSLKAKVTTLISEGNVKVVTVGEYNPKDAAGNNIDLAGAEVLAGRRALWNVTTATADDPGTNLSNSFNLDTPLGYATGAGSLDTITAPSDPSSLAYYQAYKDTANGNEATEDASGFLLTTDSTNVGFQTDLGNFGWFRQPVNFVAADLTIAIIVTPKVAQSNPTLTQRFGAKVIRVTADDTIVDVHPDNAPVYSVYGLNTDGSQTLITNGSATAIGTPSTTADYYFDVTIPTGYGAVKIVAFAKVNGSRTPGGDTAVVQIGYQFDSLGFLAGFPQK